MKFNFDKVYQEFENYLKTNEEEIELLNNTINKLFTLEDKEIAKSSNIVNHTEFLEQIDKINKIADDRKIYQNKLKKLEYDRYITVNDFVDKYSDYLPKPNVSKIIKDDLDDVLPF